MLLLGVSGSGSFQPRVFDVVHVKQRFFQAVHFSARHFEDKGKDVLELPMVVRERDRDRKKGREGSWMGGAW